MAQIAVWLSVPERVRLSTSWLNIEGGMNFYLPRRRFGRILFGSDIRLKSLLIGPVSGQAKALIGPRGRAADWHRQGPDWVEILKNKFWSKSVYKTLANSVLLEPERDQAVF